MFDQSIARAPQHEEFYKDHLISILEEASKVTTDSSFYRYYVDGKKGSGFSSMEIAVKAAKMRIDKLPPPRCEE
jgi:hypothetical protein